MKLKGHCTFIASVVLLLKGVEKKTWSISCFYDRGDVSTLVRYGMAHILFSFLFNSPGMTYVKKIYALSLPKEMGINFNVVFHRHGDESHNLATKLINCTNMCYTTIHCTSQASHFGLL